MFFHYLVWQLLAIFKVYVSLNGFDLFCWARLHGDSFPPGLVGLIDSSRLYTFKQISMIYLKEFSVYRYFDSIL